MHISLIFTWKIYECVATEAGKHEVNELVCQKAPPNQRNFLCLISQAYLMVMHLLFADYIAKHGRMSENEARKKFWQIINAVEYCHKRRVVHRDLKVKQPFTAYSECVPYNPLTLFPSFFSVG